MLQFARFTLVISSVDELNRALAAYDQEIFLQLEPVLAEMSLKSRALASNLKRCFEKFRDSDRYLRAYRGEEVAIKENELTEQEFMIFREYVRLLRSCTIMCGKDLSQAYKKLFIDFFAGERLNRARELAKSASD